jgi:hypothetical protein
MAAQWPLVAERLVALLPTLPGWSGVEVFDGPPVTGETPAQYATVGYVSDEHAGTYNTTLGPNGQQTVETGQVISQLVCATGDSDEGDVEVSSMRSQAFALMDALDAEIRRDRRLGVLSQEGTTDLAVDVLSVSNRQGTACSLVFTLTYFTVTT